MNKTLALTGLLAALLAHPNTSEAGGTAIPGYGSQAQPRAGAFVAKADDPSAIFHNPAGLAKLSGTIIQLGINLINFSQTFQRSGSYDQCTDDKCPVGGVPYAGQGYAPVENTAHGAVHIGDFAVVPLLSVVSDLGLDLPIVFAAGVFAPSVGSVDRDINSDYLIQANSNTPPPPNRYDILKQEVAVLFPSVAAGYKLNDQFSFGARISWGFGNVKGSSSTWGQRNYEEWEGFDAVYSVDASDSFIPAFGFGVLYQPRPNVELGFNYRSSASMGAQGTGITTTGSGLLLGGIDPLSPKTEDLKCNSGGTVAAFAGCVELELPRMASLGGRYFWLDAKGREKADIELDVQWENWSSASDLVNIVDAKTDAAKEGIPGSTIRHGFKDVFSFRLGGSYSIPLDKNTLSIRAGIAHDTETAETSWTRLDQDGFARTTAGLGLAFDIPGWRIEFSGGSVFEGTRVVDHGGCNPTDSNIGCSGNFEDPPANRNAPDPAQPTNEGQFQTQSPFNAGTYTQSYLFLGGGLTAWF